MSLVGTENFKTLEVARLGCFLLVLRAQIEQCALRRLAMNPPRPIIGKHNHFRDWFLLLLLGFVLRLQCGLKFCR